MYIMANWAMNNQGSNVLWIRILSEYNLRPRLFLGIHFSGNYFSHFPMFDNT